MNCITIFIFFFFTSSIIADHAVDPNIEAAAVWLEADPLVFENALNKASCKKIINYCQKKLDSIAIKVIRSSVCLTIFSVIITYKLNFFNFKNQNEAYIFLLVSLGIFIISVIISIEFFSFFTHLFNDELWNNEYSHIIEIFIIKLTNFEEYLNLFNETLDQSYSIYYKCLHFLFGFENQDIILALGKLKIKAVIDHRGFIKEGFYDYIKKINADFIIEYYFTPLIKNYKKDTPPIDLTPLLLLDNFDSDSINKIIKMINIKKYSYEKIISFNLSRPAILEEKHDEDENTIDKYNDIVVEKFATIICQPTMQNGMLHILKLITKNENYPDLFSNVGKKDVYLKKEEY